MKKFFNKYKLSIIICCTITIIGVILILLFNNFNNIKIKEYENNNYYLKYDNSWKIKKKESKSITLKHSNNGLVKIDIIDLSDNARYLTIDEVVDEVIFNIEKRNKEYKLLSKRKEDISKNKISGYRMVYENKDRNVLNSFYKTSDKLVMFTFESKIAYFDILLDSVSSIINSFQIKEENYDISKKINIDTSIIKLENNDVLDKELSKNNSYEIADNNYYVKYSIPNNFKLISFNSQIQTFMFYLNSYSITLSVNISNSNIYSYFDKNSSFNIYDSYSFYKDNKTYSNINESVDKIDGKYNGFMYRLTSENKNFDNKTVKNDNIVLLYVLNKNHTLKISIESKGNLISKKLLDSIKVLDVKNYSSYVTSEKKDGFLVGNLKKYDTFMKEKILNVILNVPDKYIELQRYNNIYESRNYALNYNEEKELYDYEVNYNLYGDSRTDDKIVESENSLFFNIYGRCDYLKYDGNIMSNGKNFDVYSGGYDNLGGIMFTDINRFVYYVNKKLLIYKIESGNTLAITISGNDRQISDEIINELTNFIVNMENNE